MTNPNSNPSDAGDARDDLTDAEARVGASLDEAFASARRVVEETAPEPKRGPGRPPLELTPEERAARLAQQREERNRRDRERRAEAKRIAEGAASALNEVSERATRAATEGAAKASARITETRAALADSLARAEARLAETTGELDKLRAVKSDELNGMLATMLGNTFAMASRILAAKRGAHWQLSPEECDALGNAWSAPLADQWEKFAAYAPWIFAGATTFNVIMPRIMADAEIASGERVAVHNGPAPVAPGASEEE